MGLFSSNKENIDTTTRQLLADKFGFQNFYWWPLNGPKPLDTECFNDNVFFTKFGLSSLIQTIKEIGDHKINKLTESKEDAKINVDELEPYNFIEVVYCNDNVEWLVYCSHENTVTVSGKKLIDALKKNWADFDSSKDTSWYD